MTPTPPPTHDLREAVARTLCSEWGYLWDGDPDDDDQVSPETNEDYDCRPSKALFRQGAGAILAGPIASELARLTGQVDELQGLLVTAEICAERLTGERDEARRRAKAANQRADKADKERRYFKLTRRA